MTEFLPGQRWINDVELQMGLGIVIDTDFRTVTIAFPACDETRTYAKQTAPLTRLTFTVGDEISNQQNEQFVVDAIDEENGIIFYSVKNTKNEFLVIPETQLSNSLQLNRPTERLFNGQVDSAKWYAVRNKTRQHLNKLAQSDIQGLNGCRTSLLPHQLYIAHEVAHRFAPRVLLADEVGLGKTIEAGLIIHQQLLTERAQRVLIVVPESLLHQWLVEMLRRFNLMFSIFDSERLNDELADFDANPFMQEQHVLCTLEFLSQHEKHYQQCLHAEWDLLVVDEAHHLQWSETSVSHEYQLIEQLALKISGVLLLTATPEQLGRESHFARLRLLDQDRFPSFEDFQQEETAYTPIAEAVEAIIDNKPVDEKLLQSLHELLDDAHNKELLATLGTVLTQKESREVERESVIEQLLDRHGTGRVLFRNTRHAIKGFPERKCHSHPLELPQEYKQFFEDVDLQSIHTQHLLCPELAFKHNETSQQWTDFDTRLQFLADLLNKLKPAKVLVITANAETALDIVEHLRTKYGLHSAVFQEEMSLVERDRAAAFFADHENGSQILVCSEIGSEGRNFQFSHHLVLFDMPENPDLLEQRIGRLDRIGQTETINIHLPYFINSAQESYFRWYHEGLNAFEQTCPAGHTVYSELKQELYACLHTPDEEDLTTLIDTTRSLHMRLSDELNNGRDRLLEYNSCRLTIANELCERSQKDTDSAGLQTYMEVLMDCFGIEYELHSEACYIIRPGSHMLNHVPGLSEDGMTITYDRNIALSNEDLRFLTWDHPFVRTCMDMALDGESGNTSVTAIKNSQLPAGSIMVECIYTLEAASNKDIQTSRYLPPTSIRILLDEKGQQQSDTLSSKQIDRQLIAVDNTTANRVIKAREAQIRQLLDLSQKKAESISPEILKSAQESADHQLNTEIERLENLMLVNPNVRKEEVAYYQNQQVIIKTLIAATALRLDSVRVIVVTH